MKLMRMMDHPMRVLQRSILLTVKVCLRRPQDAFSVAPNACRASLRSHRNLPYSSAHCGRAWRCRCFRSNELGATVNETDLDEDEDEDDDASHDGDGMIDDEAEEGSDDEEDDEEEDEDE